MLAYALTLKAKCFHQRLRSKVSVLRSRLDVRDLGRKSEAYLMTQISTINDFRKRWISNQSSINTLHTHEGNQTDDINLSSKAQVKGRYAHTPKYGQIWIFGAYLGAPYIWWSGVSLKRSCKMLFRCVGLGSIGPSSQKLWPNQIFGWFPHCNYNVKLKSGGYSRFMGLLCWKFLCVIL